MSVIRSELFNFSHITVGGGGRFSRKLWGLLSLELWHQRFHDRAAEYHAMLAVPDRGEAPPRTAAAQ